MEWENSVESRSEFTRAQKNSVLLSHETRLGLRITSKIYSFLETSLMLFIMCSKVIHRTGEVPIHCTGCFILFKPAELPRSFGKVLWSTEAAWRRILISRTS